MGRGPTIDWNPEREATLARLWRSGLKVEAIARRLGVKDEAARYHARVVLGLPARKRSPRKFYRPPPVWLAQRSA